MQATSSEREHEHSVNISLTEGEVDSFREVLRQQLLGDQELLRDCVAGREDPEIRLQVYDRIRLVQRLGERVGLAHVERRRRISPPQRGYLQIPVGVVALGAAVVLTTGVVYTAWWLGLGALPVLYVPVVVFATLRRGRRAGIWCSIGCSLAYLCLAPAELTHDIRAVASLWAMLLAIWLIRRDVFLASP